MRTYRRARRFIRSPRIADTDPQSSRRSTKGFIEAPSFGGTVRPPGESLAHRGSVREGHARTHGPSRWSRMRRLQRVQRLRCLPHRPWRATLPGRLGEAVVWRFHGDALRPIGLPRPAAQPAIVAGRRCPPRLRLFGKSATSWTPGRCRLNGRSRCTRATGAATAVRAATRRFRQPKSSMRGITAVGASFGCISNVPSCWRRSASPEVTENPDDNGAAIPVISLDRAVSSVGRAPDF